MMRSLPDDNTLYEYLFNAFHDGIFLLEGREGKVLAGNRRAWEILSVAASDVVGKKILTLSWQAIHEDGSPFSTEEYPVANTLRTGLPQRDQVMGVLTGPELKWLSVSSFPIRGERAQNKRLILLSFFDITGIKTAEHRARTN
ncbi:MAG: hypothetical protein JSU05_12945, partial [Bacteroidetes bacterium]|nr:hypothetical protein [Bacteroidota bacterium]